MSYHVDENHIRTFLLEYQRGIDRLDKLLSEKKLLEKRLTDVGSEIDGAQTMVRIAEDNVATAIKPQPEICKYPGQSSGDISLLVKIPEGLGGDSYFVERVNRHRGPTAVIRRIDSEVGA